MSEQHDWHLFDAENNYEVRRYDDTYEVRKMNEPDKVVSLTEEEFDQLRKEGPSPGGLI